MLTPVTWVKSSLGGGGAWGEVPRDHAMVKGYFGLSNLSFTTSWALTRLLFTHSYLSQNSMTSVCYCYKIPWLFQGADTLSFSRMVWISVGHKLEMHPKLVTSLKGCPWCKLIRLQNTASCFQQKFSSLNQTQCWTQFLFKAITKWNHVSMKIVSHSINLLIKQDLLITGVYPAMWD